MLCALWLSAHAQAQPATLAVRTSIAELFDAAQARELGSTMAADQPVNFQVRIAPGSVPGGVLVFVSPSPSGEIPAGWSDLLDQRHLSWVSANDYGNVRPSAQRVLVAIMATRLIETRTQVDQGRVYIAGVSGGGRIASQVITRFPKTFSGAIFIVGADFWMPAEPVKSLLAARRLVFITGKDDFNHRDMRQAFERYQHAGMQHLLFLDLPNYGHQAPNASQLASALDFLDAR